MENRAHVCLITKREVPALQGDSVVEGGASGMMPGARFTRSARIQDRIDRDIDLICIYVSDM